MSRARHFLLASAWGVAALAASVAAQVPAADDAGDGAADVAMAIRVSVPGRVAFGTPFELVVERSWPPTHAAQPFDPLGLLPLGLEEVEAGAVIDEERLVETRRYRATAWQVGELELGPFTVRARLAAQPELMAEAPKVRLVVESVLADPPGEIEWPGDVRDRRAGSALPVILALAVVLLGAGIAFQRRRSRRAAAAEPAVVEPSSAEIAERELLALALPRSEAAIEEFYIELAEIVRRHATREFGIAAVVRTSEELVAVVPVDGDPLRDCLFACDLVKFAVDRPATAAHERARQRALEFVRVPRGAT
ncbi:MAG: hypothetical protein NXI31_22645 [bacterium]|nr:hypothetical protein [bacterium]